MFTGLIPLNPSLIKKTVNSVLVIIGLLVLSALLFSPYVPYNAPVQEGKEATETIISPNYISLQTKKDKEKERAQRKKITEELGQRYSIDETINKDVKTNLSTFFEAIIGLQNSDSLVTPEHAAFLPPQDIKMARNLSANTLISLEYLSLFYTDKLLEKGLQTIDKLSLKQELHSLTQGLNLEKKHKDFITTVILHFLQANLVFDEDKTNQLIEKQLQEKPLFQTQFKEGQPILYKGEIVTQTHIEILKALNIYGNKASLSIFIGILILCFLNFLLLERFLYYFSHKLHTKTKNFILLYTVMLLICLIAWGLLSANFFPQQFNIAFLIPIPLSAMILSLLLSPNISLLSGTVISVFCAILFKGDFQLFLFLFFSNAVATFTCFKDYKRNELIYSGYIIGAFNVLFIIVLGLFQDHHSLLWYASNMLLGFGSSVLSAMITLAILPYFESLFKITTNQTLLELSNLNHPLLKRLMMTASGTYQHSIMVANLAEAAAEQVYANPILCRVGAYFHDIGKMKRPSFYSENQFSQENPHEKLAPRISKMVIASHPKEGVILGEKYKLPKVLLDIMLEHHGTSLVSFFYSQAMQVEKKSTTPQAVKEEFRYPGPKPHFKESGILMLADSVEAAVRSLKKPTLTKIESLVSKIFQERIDDDQLSNCPLSMKEIQKVKESFIKTFKSIYHSRINYDEEIQNIIQQTHESESDSN